MKLRRIQLAQDYPILRSWWERRGGGAPPEAILPEIGMVAVSEGEMIACAWLYLDQGGKAAMVEWEATNPDSSPMTQLLGLNIIFGFFEDYRKERKIAALLSWVSSNGATRKILQRRQWFCCQGERHELMAFTKAEGVCL